MRRATITILTCALFLALTGPAWAVAEFQKEFLAMYIKEHKDKEFAEYVEKKVKCFVCHQGKKAKKNRNAYGAPLSELLDAKKDKKEVKKIQEALAKVGAMHSDAKDEKSPTFAELIADSKLPTGNTLADLEKEPESAEGGSEKESQ